MPHHSSPIHGRLVVGLPCYGLMALHSYTIIILSTLLYELELFMCWQCFHARLVRLVCEVTFLGYICWLSYFVFPYHGHYRHVSILSDPFFILVNPILVIVYNLPCFNFVSRIKCKIENGEALISTDPIHFHPSLGMRDLFCSMSQTTPRYHRPKRSDHLFKDSLWHS